MPGKPVQKVSARAAERAFDNLDLSELTQRYDSDDSISAREAVRRFYWQIIEMRDRGLTYLGISEFLAETLQIELSPNTLKTYLTQLATARTLPAKPKSGLRSGKPKASTPVHTEATVISVLPVQQQEPIQPPIVATAKPLVVSTKPPAAKPASTQSSDPRSQPPPVVPSGDSEDAPIAEFSPEDLEAALQIPELGDKVATEKFLQALKQLKTIDPGRWQELRADAKRAGVNVLGIVTPSASHLFNQY
jgi:hypothetical protein